MVMRICSPVVLSYLDAGFQPRCGRKDFWIAYCLLLLLLLKCVAHPWTLRRGVQPEHCHRITQIQELRKSST